MSEKLRAGKSGLGFEVEKKMEEVSRMPSFAYLQLNIGSRHEEKSHLHQLHLILTILAISGQLQ